MKKKNLELITKILAIVIICLISFVGIYVQKFNSMKNIVKDYTLGKDLKGYRQVILKLSDATKVLDSDGKLVGNTDSYSDETIESSKYTKSDEKVNKDENLKVENYELCKNIIEKRLKDYEVTDYNISLDKETGTIYFQIPENEMTDTIVTNIKEIGSLELKDSEDGTVYINSNDIKIAKTLYSTTEKGTTVYLEVKFNSNGKKVLKDLTTNQYATLPEKEESSNENSENSDSENKDSENENSENNDSENKDSENSDSENKESESNEKEEEKQKKLILSISGSDMITTSFDEPIEDGIIDLSMGAATTDNSQLSESIKSASTIALLLNNGEMPLLYKIEENQYVLTEISNDLIKNVIIITSVVFAILLVYMILKNKIRGLLSAICFIGFVALYLFVLRYTNVEISIVSIVGILLMSIINYIFSMNLLKIEAENKEQYNKKYLDFILKVIPALVVSIVFCFMKWSVLTSIGMTAFWGFVLILVYNILVTKNIVN